MTAKEPLRESYSKLEQLRDELKVQLNLGKLQVRDAWEDAEAELRKVEARMKKLGERGGEEVDRLRDETREMMKNARQRFEQLRKKT